MNSFKEMFPLARMFSLAVSTNLYWLNRYKTEVMITCLTEMPGLPNFAHMTTFTI